MKKIIIYDLDGCLIDSTHRYRVGADGNIDLPFWLENEHLAMLDHLLPLSNQYQEQIADPDLYVVIATARVLNHTDWRFLTEILGLPDRVISRNGRDDFRSGVELKTSGLSYLKNLKQFKDIEKHFYEDNVVYLKGVCDYLDCRGTYIPSKQGH